MSILQYKIHSVKDALSTFAVHDLNHYYIHTHTTVLTVVFFQVNLEQLDAFLIFLHHLFLELEYPFGAHCQLDDSKGIWHVKKISHRNSQRFFIGRLWETEPNME